MPTSTISIRLGDEEVAELDRLSEWTGLDRSTVSKAIFRKGISAWRFGIAVEKYRAEKVTLSRACEIAGISQWDFLGRMNIEGLELHYGPEELEEDLLILEKLP